MVSRKLDAQVGHRFRSPIGSVNDVVREFTWSKLQQVEIVPFTLFSSEKLKRINKPLC